MDIGPALWLFMTLSGAALLSAGLAYGLVSTRRRRKNPVAQRVTEAGTRDVYHAEEERRADIEDEGTAIAAQSRRERVTATEARQASPGTTSMSCSWPHCPSPFSLASGEPPTTASSTPDTTNPADDAVAPSNLPGGEDEQAQKQKSAPEPQPEEPARFSSDIYLLS